MITTTRVTRVLLASTCLAFAPQAFAQDPAPAAAPAVTETAQVAEADDGSEELTVTATRRATKIQSTPIAITAVGEKAIENASIRETQSLTQVVPSLAFPQSESSGSVTARVRGVGTQGSNPGLESAVGIFIDGVYRSRNSTAFGDLGDIQRVEVLRGPQGTLFGRNTSAGLISVITREPSLDAFSGSASATYETFNGYYLTGSVTGPIEEGVAGFRLFGSYRKVDGYMDILSGPTPDVRSGNDKESWNLRGQLLWKPIDGTSIKFIVDGSHRDDECCYAATVDPGGPGVLGRRVHDVVNTILGYPGTSNVNSVEKQIGYADRRHPQIIDEFGISGEVNHSFSWGDFTSITAYRDWKLEGGSDADYTAADFLWTDPNVGFQHFKTFTQEFRLTGSSDWLDWLVGGFYSNENLTRETSTLNGRDTEAFLSLYSLGASATQTRTLLGLLPFINRPGITPYAGGNTHALGTGLHDYYEQDAESIAVFTHNTITLTDAFKVTLGLRYTSETKEVDATYRTNTPAGCAYLESQYGLNPGGTSLFNIGGGGASGAAAFCVPWGRSALDVLTANAPLHQKKTEEEFSGIATLAYEFTDNFNMYATYSRGYKAGGFNLDRAYSLDNGTAAGSSIVRCPDGSDGSPAQFDSPVGTPGRKQIVAANPYTCANPSIVVAPDISFVPEFVDAYEIGAKTTLMGGDLQLNLAVFYQDFTDYQLNTFTGVSFVVTSVPEVISKGIEVDFNWFTNVDGLSFNGGVSYTDARYGNDLGDLSTPGSFLFENPNLQFLPGEQLTSAPKWTMTFGTTYEFPIFGGAWNGLFHIDARKVTDQRTGSNLDPRKTQDDYTLVNLRLGVATEDDAFSLEFWAKNLFDERYFQITFDAPLQGSAPTALVPTPANYSRIGAFLGEPITFGVTAKARF